MRASFGIEFTLVTAVFASVDAATTGALRGVNEIGAETRRLDQMGSGLTADGNEVGKDLQEKNNYGQTRTECHFGNCWAYDL
ncbi:hypothetical protein V7S43_012870 [Phytophthora oleae]|uniref:RxLR effector protein n=1 Tax=Phytophthora oleae TaxID=2107226 RepID=A0ABD3F9B5_9STRA